MLASLIVLVQSALPACMMLFAVSLLMLTACAKKKKQDAKSLDPTGNAQPANGKKKDTERTQRLSIHGEPDISEETEATQQHTKPKPENTAELDKQPMQATQPTRERTTVGQKSKHSSKRSKHSMKSDATQTQVTRTQSSMGPRTDSTRASSARVRPEARAKTTSAEPTQESRLSKEGAMQQLRDADVQPTQTVSEKLAHRSKECGTA
ncbi:hypothetical protein AAVH_01471 [Aphelenchoides avenae]|nr:hypothetical protein AAVH_01471 [Aphelenchus avenae]